MKNNTPETSFLFNPPLRVFVGSGSALSQSHGRFNRPNLKSAVSNDRVSRYFQKPRPLVRSSLD